MLYTVPRRSYDIVDVIGAADAFLGSYVAATSRGLAVPQALLWAHAGGCLTTMKRGAQDAIARPNPSPSPNPNPHPNLNPNPNPNPNLLEIPPQAFRPQPKCSVSALRFHPSATPAGRDAPLSAAQRTQLLALVKLTFEQRRKMLRQSLKR